MRKVFLGLFIILLCFTIGISQEKKKVTVDDAIKTWTRTDFEKLSSESLVNVILQFQEVIRCQDEQIATYKEQQRPKLQHFGVPYYELPNIVENKQLDEDYLRKLERIKEDIQRETSRQVFNEISLRNDMQMFDSMQRGRLNDYYFWSLFPNNPYNPYRYLYLRPLNLKGWDYILLFDLLKKK